MKKRPKYRPIINVAEVVGTGTGTTFVENPFESEAQRGWMYANHPEMARRWEEHTPKGKKLPRRKGKVSVKNAARFRLAKRQAILNKQNGKASETPTDPPLPKKRVNPLLIDPSRTLDIRKRFSEAVEAQFDEINKRIQKALVEENWLGLTANVDASGHEHDEKGRFTGGDGPPPEKPTIEQFQEWTDKGWTWGKKGWEPPVEASKAGASGDVSQELHDAASKLLDAGARKLIADSRNWEDSKPWNATEEDVKSGKVSGVKFGSYEGRGHETAHYETGKIVVSAKFFEIKHEDSRRHVLYHELGHQLADTMVYDGTSFGLHDAGVIPAEHDMGSGTIGGHGDEEALADAYATLHSDPRWLKQHYPKLIKPVVDRARALGMPLPKGVVVNAEIDPDGERSIAIDFDETISKSDSPPDDFSAKEPREGAIDALKRLKAAGLLVIVHTANPDLDKVKQWMVDHGAPFDRIEGKMAALAYVDDKAVHANRPWRDILPHIFEKAFGDPRQPADTWKGLEKRMPAARQEMLTILKKLRYPVIDLTKLTLGGLEAILHRPGGKVLVAPNKKEKRAREKVKADYDGDWSRLMDPVRATVACDNLDQIRADSQRVLDWVRDAGGNLARPPKDRFLEPAGSGYRDYMVNYRLPCGMVVEVQYNLKPMLVAREREILSYDAVRAIRASMEREGRDEKTPGEAEAMRRVEQGAKQLFARAWEESKAAHNASAGNPCHDDKGRFSGSCWSDNKARFQKVGEALIASLPKGHWSEWSGGDSPSGKGGTWQLLVTMPDSRKVRLRLDNDIVSVDFGTGGMGVGRSVGDFSNVGEGLEKGTLSMLRFVKKAVADIHAAGFPIRATPSDDRRDRLYTKALEGMGLKRDEHDPHLWNALCDEPGVNAAAGRKESWLLPSDFDNGNRPYIIEDGVKRYLKINAQSGPPELLALPNIRQRNEHECGAAAVHAVALKYGVADGALDDTVEELGTTEDGTLPGPIIAFFKDRDCQVEAKADLTLDDLERYHERGWPVLVLVQDYTNHREDVRDDHSGHWLTYVGSGLDHLFFQDSYLDNWVGLSRKDPLAPGGSVLPSREREKNLSVPGLVVVRPRAFLEAWHDRGSDGKNYDHYGIAVGPPITDNSNPCHDARGRFTHCGPQSAGTGVIDLMESPADAPAATPPAEKPKSPPKGPTKRTLKARAALKDQLRTLVDSSLDKVEGLTEHDEAVYHGYVQQATESMPNKALELLTEGLKGGFTFAKDLPEVRNAWAELTHERDDVVYAYYQMGAHRITIDKQMPQGEMHSPFVMTSRQDSTTVSGYVHEMGHAIDRALFEREVARKSNYGLHAKKAYISNSSHAWATAFNKEIAGPGGRLSGYAQTSRHEGFAEFARLVYHSDVPLSTIESNMPLCTRLWKKWGLWPERRKGAERTSDIRINSLGGNRFLIADIFNVGGRRKGNSWDGWDAARAGATVNYSPNQARDRKGQFASEYGATAAGPDSTERGNDEGSGADKGLVDKVRQRIGSLYDRLPDRVKKGVAVVARTAYAVQVASNKAVKAVAKERGFTKEQIDRLSFLTASVDVGAGGSRSAAAFAAAGLAHLAGPAAFVPWGSIGYLLYSTVRAPIAVLRAAKKAVKAGWGLWKRMLRDEGKATIRNEEGEAFDALENQEDVRRLADAVENGDWYTALLMSLLDEGLGVKDASRAADLLWATTPEPTFPTRWPGPGEPVTDNYEGQPRDTHGRFSTEGGEARALARKIWATGGATYQPIGTRSPKEGIVVSLPREMGYEMPLTEEEFSHHPIAILKKYLQRVRDDLKSGKLDSKAHFGAWRDTQTGRVVLDVNEVYKDKEEATRVGCERKQDALYDIKAGAVIDLRSDECAKYSRNAGTANGRGDRRGVGRPGAADSDGVGINFDPNQPRVPAGQPGGGRFGSVGGGTGTSGKPTVEEVQHRFDDRWDRDAKGMVKDYLKSAGPGNSDHPGTYTINMDDARELCPEYAASREGRLAYMRATNLTASRIAMESYRHAIRQPVAPGHSPVVVFTAGGPGSGKTSGLGGSKNLSDTVKNAHVVFDSSEALPGMIQKALDHGLRVHIIYTYRDAEDAFTNGVLPRAMESGRPVSARSTARLHVAALKTFEMNQTLFKDEPNVAFSVIDNSRGKGKAAVTDSIPKGADRDESELRDRLKRASEEAYRRGRIDASVHRAVLELQGASQGAGGADGKEAKRVGNVRNTRFAFHTSPDKLKAFLTWVAAQIGQTVTSANSKALWDRFIREGFARGAGRAFDDVHKPYAKGYAEDESTKDFWRGSKLDFLRQAFAQPVSRERVQMLGSRTFDDLKNVTHDMATRIGRVLMDGLVTGKHPRDIGKELSEQVGISKTRGRLIAQTEIVRAHATGQLMALKQLGVTKLGVVVEFTAADDPTTCDECAALDGEEFDIDEAWDVIPQHPGCRCAWRPGGKSLTGNVFCAKGKGGGVDPTCKPGSDGKTRSKAKVTLIKNETDNDPDVQKNFTAAVSKLLDGDIHNAADLVGASDNDEVEVSSGFGGEEIRVEVHGPDIRSMSRRLGVDRDGHKYIHNSILEVMKPGKGLGLRYFEREVEAARAAGYSYLEAYAAGDKGDPDWNGYYTWPLFGYDAPLYTTSVRREAKRAFPQAETVLDVFSSPGGRQWWQENGSAVDARFDLDPKSRSSKVFAAYLEERKIRAVKNVEQVDALAEDIAAAERVWDKRVTANFEGQERDSRGRFGRGSGTKLKPGKPEPAFDPPPDDKEKEEKADKGASPKWQPKVVEGVPSRIGKVDTFEEAMSYEKPEEATEEEQKAYRALDLAHNHLTFHGTTDDALESIKQNGLVPGKGVGAAELAGVVSDRNLRVHSVYLTQSKRLSDGYADFVAENKDHVFGGRHVPITLAITLPDDPDVLDKVGPDPQTPPWASALRYEGVIPPEWIKVVSIRKREGVKSPSVNARVLYATVVCRLPGPPARFTTDKGIRHYAPMGPDHDHEPY